MRLIDGDKLKKRLLDYFTYSMQLCTEISDFIDNAPTIEPDSDTVSRQQAIDANCDDWCGCTNANCPYGSETEHYCDGCDTVCILKTLPPSPTPIRPKGRWIIHGEPPMYVKECSVCDEKFFHHQGQTLTPYCSMCGADMRPREYTASLETPCDDCDFADRCTYESNCPREAIWEAEHKMEE